MSQPLICVVGMHRSGTSLCAAALQALGVAMADEAAPSPDNPRGHYERPRINDAHDAIFAALGRPWGSTAHALALPAHWLGHPRAQQARADIAAWLAPRLANGTRFGIKDPRMARLLPLWRLIAADLAIAPRWVFCVREPAQVARSLSARDRFAPDHAEYRWLVYNAEAVAGLGADPVLILPYGDWFTHPRETAARLAVWAGSAAPPQGWAENLVDPTLRHDEPAEPRPIAARLFHALTRAAPANRLGADTQALATMIREFEAQVQPLLVEQETLRASIAAQNRVIADLNALIGRLRKEERVLS